MKARAKEQRMLSSSSLVSALDRPRKVLFATIAQAIDSGPQAITELFTLDARTLFVHVSTAIFTNKSADLRELSNPL